jgi:hypothetical protein
MVVEVMEAEVARLRVTAAVVAAGIPLRAAVAHNTGEAAVDLTVADMVDNNIVAANLHNRR